MCNERKAAYRLKNALYFEIKNASAEMGGVNFFAFVQQKFGHFRELTDILGKFICAIKEKRRTGLKTLKLKKFCRKKFAIKKTPPNFGSV